jgi:hypothetical protein
LQLQVSYFGHAPTDLCYLIYSSSTLLSRQKYLDFLLKLYFDTFLETLNDLKVAFKPSFDTFYNDFIQVSKIQICKWDICGPSRPKGPRGPKGPKLWDIKDQRTQRTLWDLRGSKEPKGPIHTNDLGHGPL